MSAEDILETLPHLTPAQVHDALSYYHDHTDEIDARIGENDIRRVADELGLRMAEDGKLQPVQ